MSGSYCPYYSCHAIVVTTIITTVAMENSMTTHAIFFLIYGCSMSGTVFKKKSSFKATTTTKTTTTTTRRRSMQRSLVQKSGEPKITMNARSRTFAVIAMIAGTSRACVGSSRGIGTFRNHASLGTLERVVTTVPGK